jgi:methyl-accepting chemotaxis protein
VHARYHPALKRAAETVGFYDINLMDAATGDVVYTVAKEIDFAGNMYNGAFTQSGFARVARRALDPRNGGKAVIGHWIMVEGKPAEVVEMDWRTVTLGY